MFVLTVHEWLAPAWRHRTAAPDDLATHQGSAEVAAVVPKDPSRVTVRRTAKDDVQDRQVYLTLDGEEWVTLLYGKEVTREIAPGTHVLKANNTLVRKSVTFEVKPGEHVRFQCINKAHWTAMVFMAFLGAAVLTVKLVREPSDPS